MDTIFFHFTQRRFIICNKNRGGGVRKCSSAGSLGMTVNTFGIAVCTASVVIISVCKVISKYLGPKYLYSRDQTEMRDKVSEFESKFEIVVILICVNNVPIISFANY